AGEVELVACRLGAAGTVTRGTTAEAAREARALAAIREATGASSPSSTGGGGGGPSLRSPQPWQNAAPAGSGGAQPRQVGSGPLDARCSFNPPAPSDALAG